jgi:outer membrane protein with beta-barrel domain
MNRRSASTLMWLALGAATGAAQAEDFGSHASFALFAGSNAAMPGSFRGQTVPFDTVDPAGSIVYHDLKFSDAYDHRYTSGAEFAYAFNPEVAAYGRFSYAQFDGREHRVGTFMSSADEPSPVTATFGDTHTQEYDLGARYTFLPGSRLRPFVGGSLGATRLGATRAEFVTPGVTGGTKVTLGEADTVFSQRFETGLQFAPLENFDLRLTASANHLDADTRSTDPNLALVGLANTQADVRNHWDYPIELAAVWNFSG